MSAARPERAALVTGAAQGLGEAIARRLHADGFRVAVADINVEAARTVAASLDASGRTAFALPVDVADPVSIHDAVDTFVRRWSVPDVLVNNAGRTVRTALWDITADEWDAVLETNLRGCFLLTQRVASLLRGRGWGRIVNVASLAGQQGGLVAGAHYAASKAGMLVLTKVFARAVAGDGITVNAVAPAAVRSPAMRSGEEGALAETIPVGRVGSAEEVAAAVAYLVGPDSGYVTGATIDVNGGVFTR
ncbi:SDR family oxidoreductase [Xylanimonas allomyrinae]|uniref:SDR family oxidoreductase n=1 Tax=Xylanimonas allomyrinae TaxID=2509459 RepID=A0A4P6EJB9_9MICO|nr:SDR family NAD(P)-dependent oxidoreductase [Xylanimonas allomyrinae]QAY62584.1 SDR family oxidoreductase [Xylanimonas allomyrinae]